MKIVAGIPFIYRAVLRGSSHIECNWMTKLRFVYLQQAGEHNICPIFTQPGKSLLVQPCTASAFSSLSLAIASILYSLAKREVRGVRHIRRSKFHQTLNLLFNQSLDPLGNGIEICMFCLKSCKTRIGLPSHPPAAQMNE